MDPHSRTAKEDRCSVEMRCFRRILGISYTDHVTNEEILKTIAQHVGHYDDPLTTGKKRKLRWYGHVTRSSGLSKTVPASGNSAEEKKTGKTEGGRKRCRTDYIEEWTGKTFARNPGSSTQPPRLESTPCSVHRCRQRALLSRRVTGSVGSK